MRLLALLRGDIRFQWKYGFYFLYGVFAAVYAMIIFAVSPSVRPTVATILIFTDPGAMGLFFMGAIVLLEKSQRVNCALSASPAGLGEYIGAKLLSLALIGALVALVLAICAGMKSLLPCMAGVLLTSFLCSLCGLIVAMRVSSLNQFLVFTVPFELLICLPPALLLFGVWHPVMLLHPGVAGVLLIFGGGEHTALCLLSLLVWLIPAYAVCRRDTKRCFMEQGGAKL